MQSRNATVALDVMGGDNAPAAALFGADLFLKKNKNLNVRFRLFGNSELISAFIAKNKLQNLLKSSELVDASSVVEPDEKPAFAIRKKKDSSMYMAVKSAREKKSDCVLSAGNTGAFMAISKISLGMLQSVHRPAIVTTIPTNLKEMVVLDLGANLECNSDILFQFAFMGVAFAKSSLRLKKPSVGLLNIGTEETKGTDTLKETFHLLKNSKDKIDFCGFVEPNTILDSKIDVLVTDGFCGNIMLKTAESMYQLIKDNIAQSTKKSFLGAIAGFLLRKSLKRSMARFNPKLRNGAMLIGLNGIAVKAHGSSDAESFAHSIKSGVDLVFANINCQIIDNIYNID